VVNVAIEAMPTAFKFRNYHISTYYVQENADKLIDQVYREFKLSARQLCDHYRADGDAIPEKIREEGESDDLNKSETMYTLIHAVYPNPDYKLTDRGEPLIGNKNKAFRSVTVCRELKSVIRDSGFDYLPYTVARFEKKADSMYGFSPGLRILRTAKMLNSGWKTLLKAGQKAVDPPVMLDGKAYNKTFPASFFNHPGAVNYWDSSGGAQPPQFAPVPSNLAIGSEMMQDFRRAIDAAYFVNLFQLLQQLAENTNRDKTAFEVMQLVSEKHALIIPIVARILEELFQPLFIKAFHLAMQQNMLPPVPEILRKTMPDVEVSFDSPLAMAAKRSHIKTAFDAMTQLASLAQFDGGQCLDYLNLDELAKSVLENSGVDPKYIRSKPAVEALRKQRTDMMQRQAAMQQMGDLAKSQDLTRRPEAGSAMEMLAKGG
jgi:Bacteriophage head to tail connecting protein.